MAGRQNFCGMLVVQTTISFRLLPSQVAATAAAAAKNLPTES